jgi:hypothetical protein
LCRYDGVQDNVPETDGFGNESVMDTTVGLGCTR